MFVAKYRKIPVTIQLSNVFWARSNNLGSLYIGEERWGARRGGGGVGAYSGECLRHGPITGVALARRGWGTLMLHEKEKNEQKGKQKGFILSYSD